MGLCSPVEIPLMTLERLRSIAIFGAMFESASIGAMQLWQPIGNEVQKNDLDRHFTSERGIDMLNFGGACTRWYRSAAITPATLLPTDLSGISAGYRTHHWVTRPTGYLRAGSRRNFRREIVVAVRISNELNETLRDVICCQLRRDNCLIWDYSLVRIYLRAEWLPRLTKICEFSRGSKDWIFYLGKMICWKYNEREDTNY